MRRRRHGGQATPRRRSTCWSGCASFIPTKKTYRHRYCTFDGTLPDRARNGRSRSTEAIALFEQLNAQSPDLPDYRLLVPGLVFLRGRETQAIEMLEKAVAEFPQRPEYREELAYLYERRAIQLCQSGDLPNAVPILRKLAKEFPKARASLANWSGN